MCSLNSILIACFFVVLLVSGLTAQSNRKDAIGFPESEENTNLKNKENRQPVFLPAMCPINELFYPGDQKDDWICDCRPAYIYHPGTDACWAAYQRGPCPDGQHLVLPENSVIPKCLFNPCNNTYVLFNGKCEKLGSTTPCAHMFPLAAAVGVNATTLAISCVRLSLESRFADNPPEIPNTICPPGCKRSINGKCVPVSL